MIKLKSKKRNIIDKITLYSVGISLVIFLIFTIIPFLLFLNMHNVLFLILTVLFFGGTIYIFVGFIKMLMNPQNDTGYSNYTGLLSSNINQNIKIDIDQVKQNFGIIFECKKDNKLLFKGQDTFIEEHLPAKMEDANGNLIFSYHMNLVEFAKSQIPDGNHTSRDGFIESNEKIKIGRIYQEGTGKDRFYKIEYNNDIFEIFMWSTGEEPHLSVFLNKKQIAQIEHEHVVQNNLDKYHLYLLSEYQIYESILCFFAIIYDKYENGHHGQAFYGEKTETSFEYSLDGIGSDKYFKEFMQYNFPTENIVSKEITGETIKQDMKQGWKKAKEQTFTKEAYQHALKVGLPFCLIISISIFVILLLFGEFILGIVSLIITLLSTFLFFLFIKSICKN